MGLGPKPRMLSNGFLVKVERSGMGLPQASIAVIEVYPGVDDVYTIADHAPGVVRVVRRWNKVPYSHPSTEEYRATLGEARQLAAELRG